MAQNDTFTVGQILTATEMNKLPFGVCDYGDSSSDFNLTTSLVIATGMTVTWTADATRLYKITYFEPQVRGSSAASSYVDIELRQTNAAGTQLQSTFVWNGSAVQTTLGSVAIFIGTFSGTPTVVGCALASSVTGTPRLSRSATTKAFIIVEDIGLA